MELAGNLWLDLPLRGERLRVRAGRVRLAFAGASPHRLSADDFRTYRDGPVQPPGPGATRMVAAADSHLVPAAAKHSLVAARPRSGRQGPRPFDRWTWHARAGFR